MSSYNLSRGEELFFKEIDRLSIKHSQIQMELKILASCFAGKVGVMQEEAVSFNEFTDESQLLFTVNGIPAYKKLSLSILDALVNCNTSEMKDQIVYVFQSYNNGSYKKFEDAKIDSAVKSEKDIIEENNQIEQNLRDYQNLVNQIMFDEDNDGNLVSKIIEVDSIDLLDDFEEEDMTSEGLRASGIIDVNFDTLDSKPLEKKVKSDKILNGIIEILPDNSLEIICPYTGSKNVYQIDSSTFASFETDQPFKVRLNLADLKPDQD